MARTHQDGFGKILRRNIAYGTLGQHGTTFVGFCSDQRILQAMLESMIGLRGGPLDQLTAATRPPTGAYYVIPSVERLASFAAAAQDA